MASDSRLVWIVFTVLVALVAAPFAVHRLRHELRPRIVDARIVSSTGADPVLRTGPRTVDPDEELRLAIALRVERRWRSPAWVAPDGPIEIDGSTPDGLRWTSWPEDDRELRVFWFTIECTTVGGVLGPGTAEDRLDHRPFLAPEMGRGLVAATFPSQHNDDALGPRLDGLPTDGGTVRLYARVELVDRPDAVRPIATVTTTEPSRFAEPLFPTVHRRTDIGPGIDPSAGEMFRLPGFEIEGKDAADWVLPVVDMTVADATRRRLMMSSWTFAAVAVSGRPSISPPDLSRLGPLTASGERLRLDGGPARWGREVQPGDLISDGEHWVVLVGDDGNGDLDPVDPVVHCWRAPPTRSRLGLVADVGDGELALYRHER